VPPLVLFAIGSLVAGAAAASVAIAGFFWLVAAMRLLFETLSSSVDYPVLNIPVPTLPQSSG